MCYEKPAPMDIVVKAGLSDVVTECDIDVSISDVECKSLLFIAGYVGFKLVNNVVSCDLCRNDFITNDVLEFDTDSEHFFVTYLIWIEEG